MKLSTIIIFLLCSLLLVSSEEVSQTRDLVDNVEDYDDLGRKHRKKKKHQSSPCYGGYGRTFGDKFGHHDHTYVSAPVTNYFFGCGGPVAPLAPIQQYPVHGDHGHGGHGHGGHGGHVHGGHGHGGHGHGGHGGYGQYGGLNGPANYGYNQGFNQPYQFGHYQQPFYGPGNAVAAAASGFGNLVAGYFNRPRKVNKQINQFLRPLHNLF